MKNEFNWPSSFRGEVFENVDGRRTDAGHRSHWYAFGSGELQMFFKTNYRLMQIKSIVTFCNIFDLH